MGDCWIPAHKKIKATHYQKLRLPETSLELRYPHQLFFWESGVALLVVLHRPSTWSTQLFSNVQHYSVVPTGCTIWAAYISPNRRLLHLQDQTEKHAEIDLDSSSAKKSHKVTMNVVRLSKSLAFFFSGRRQSKANCRRLIGPRPNTRETGQPAPWQQQLWVARFPGNGQSGLASNDF